MNKLLLLTIVSIFYFSCKKEKETIHSEQKTTYYDILLAGKWHFSANIIKPALNGDTDIYATYVPCAKDDTIYFKKDSVFTLNNGALKCYPNDSQETDYTWWLSGDTLITMNTFPYKIKSLDKNQMVLNFTQKIGATVHTYTATYRNLR